MGFGAEATGRSGAGHCPALDGRNGRLLRRTELACRGRRSGPLRRPLVPVRAVEPAAGTAERSGGPAAAGLGVVLFAGVRVIARDEVASLRAAAAIAARRVFRRRARP